MGAAEGGAGRGAVRDGPPLSGRAPDGGGRRLAAAERGEVALRAARTGAVVEGGAAPHTLVAPGGVGARVRAAARRGPPRPRRGVPRRHQRPRPPEGRRGKGGPSANSLGRSRGGYGTKACAACDARGLPLGFALIPGQASELRAAPALLLLAAHLGPLGRVVCDGSYASAPWLALIEEAGATPVVRPNPTHRRARDHDRAAYRGRHRVENLWARLKEWRAVATRHDKTAASFLGGLHLAAAFDWLSNGP